jgi:hypothetical protein
MNESDLEKRAFRQLNPLLQGLYESADDGYREYTSSLYAAIHCPRTAAANVNDHIIAKLINRFDGILEPVEDRRYNQKFLRLAQRSRPLLLWVKKINTERKFDIALTRRSRAMDEGNMELFPRGEILTLGYVPSRDRLRVAKITISPPCSNRRGKPEWWIDAVGVTRIGIRAAGAPSVVRVERSSQRRLEA